MQMLWNHWEESVKWRVAFLAWSRSGDSAHTVLLQDIPGIPHGTVIGRIFDVRSLHQRRTARLHIQTTG